MTEAGDERSSYAIPFSELDDERVKPEDMVEVKPAPVAPQPDPRGESPDREWFASGG